MKGVLGTTLKAGASGVAVDMMTSEVTADVGGSVLCGEGRGECDGPLEGGNEGGEVVVSQSAILSKAVNPLIYPRPQLNSLI